MSAPDRETKKLDSEILSFVRRFGARRAPDRVFSELALKIFRYQFQQNAPYRRWCAADGRTPGNIRHWKEIPAIPAQAFKSLRLACFPPKETVRFFQTSGTSEARRGRHELDTLRLYEASIPGPFKKRFLRDSPRLAYFFLMPSPQETPDSSLSYMMGVVNRVFAGGKGRFYVRAGRPDYMQLSRDLSQTKNKVFLLATAFALKGFLEHLKENGRKMKLKSGSRIMETGGFKGRTAEISKKELYRLCGKWLGVPSRRIGSEYGMTELSSQYYDGVGPAWLRAVVVDPRTGKEARRGSIGVLRHVDLANRGSVLAVETQDLGRQRQGRIELLGRAKQSDLRGCSLSFEEFLNT